MGWFDGNPAHLWEHPPAENARRYVDCLGGIEATLVRAKSYAEEGDLRFAATLLGHAVFAEPDNAGARELLASVYERLGYGSENGTWRNFYLTGARELREGVQPVAIDTNNPELTAALTTEQLIDSLAVRINGPRAWHEHLVVDWVLTDENLRHRLTLSHGALTHLARPLAEPAKSAAALTLTLTKGQLLGMFAGQGLEEIKVDGDPRVLARLLSFLDEPDKGFAIVTP